MAVIQLMQRILGIAAICLAAIMIPVSSTQRVTLLAALGLGLGLAALVPGYDRVAARIIGPVVLVMALAPLAGPFAIVHLAAVFLAGFAAFNRSGMSRLVPALGLPLMIMVLRTGTAISWPVVALWAGLVAAMLVLGGRLSSADLGPQLAPTALRKQQGVAFARRRMAHALIALGVTVPFSILAAEPVSRVWAEFGPADSFRLGGQAGSVDRAVGDDGGTEHPGLTSGLDVGAPVVLSDRVVLRVVSERPMYWRGSTYDNWDGRRWTSTIDPGPSWSQHADALTEPNHVESSPVGQGAITVEQEFTLVGAALDVGLAAWRPEQIDFAIGSGAIAIDGTVHPSVALKPGSTWTVTSSVIPATADDLRLADPATLSLSSEVMVNYGNEDTVVPRVAELAAEITADATTTYDKVIALESWMDDNLTYTRDIQRLAPGHDAVSELLFGSRRGFCEQIGSALVVMLRSLGIPARLVVGYVPSSYDGTTGEWLSRGEDAHAWAEVYFPGVGWQGFDPTAGVPLLADGDTLISSGAWPTVAGWLWSRWVLAVVVGAGAAAVVASGFPRFVRGAVRGVGPLRRLGAGRRFDAEHRIDTEHRFDAERRVMVAEAARARLDESSRRLGCIWPENMTLREKGEELQAAGIDADVVGRAVRSVEQLWFFPATGGQGRQLEQLVDVALKQLEWCIQVYELDTPQRRRAPA